MNDQRTKSFVFEGRKTGAINPVLPYFILAFVLLALGLWRIATTDPAWKDSKSISAEGQSRPPAAEPEIKPLGETKTADAAPVASAVEPAAPAPAVEQPKPAPAAKPVPPPDAPSPANDVDLYLADHLGQPIPFLYKGQSRSVVLVAFTDDTVTIKTKKAITLNRKDLSEEQLKLWK